MYIVYKLQIHSFADFSRNPEMRLMRGGICFDRIMNSSSIIAL